MEDYHYILNWIQNNFSEIGNISDEEFNTEKKRMNIIIQCIKAFLNREYDCDMNINNTYTKTLYTNIHNKMNINFIENNKSDIRVNFLQMVLICRGYSCDFNGQYTSTTMKVFKRFKSDNKIKTVSKYPYQITSTIWYKLLTNKNMEEN